MSMRLDAALAETGTRFRIFPQPRFLTAFSRPETIRVSVTPSEIQPGPADDRMFVVDAINKLPYRSFFGPPFRGERNPPVRPNSEGHFDHLDPDSREFLCATMYATVRRALDIWEDYNGERIDWHFNADFARLEMIPLIEWDNAQSGYGFLEFGFGRKRAGGIDRSRPYSDNCDVLLHEFGHGLIFSIVGVPENPLDEALDYGGMHESAGDLVAIISALHFHSVVNHLLENTKGNLFTVNELDRVGELSESEEIRVAFNNVRMSDVSNDDEPHNRSAPLTGGIFDIMVEVFQKELVKRHLISQDLATRSTHGIRGSQDLDAIQREFEAAYKGHEPAFKDALLTARDYVGRLLAVTWRHLSPHFLTYHTILRGLLRADRQLGGQHQQTIRECFEWREITAPPNAIFLRPHRVIERGLTYEAAPSTAMPREQMIGGREMTSGSGVATAGGQSGP